MSESIVWKGRGFKGDPTKVYNEIKSLGEATPEDIVFYAQHHENSELHKCFTWDDTEAADKWRKQEARMIVCSLQVVVIKEEKEPVTYRLIQHDRDERVYRPVTLTVRNEDEYNRLLKQAKAELAAFRKRYKRIVELSDVIDEIDKLIW